MQPRRSLKARALQWLAQREHSRVELGAKLLRHAVAEADAQAGVEADSASSPTAPKARVDAVLDWLEAHDYLSQQRFVESRIRARAPRFGNLRIRQELKQHQLALPSDAARSLDDSELHRAGAVRERKFARAPVGAAEHARQARFLAGRGFSPDVIRRVLRAASRPKDDAESDADAG